MFESRNICDLGLLQNARTHGPRGTVKTIETYILHRTQVHYFCSGNSNQDAYGRYFQVLPISVPEMASEMFHSTSFHGGTPLRTKIHVLLKPSSWYI